MSDRESTATERDTAVAMLATDVIPLGQVAVMLGEHQSSTFARLTRRELRGFKLGKRWFCYRADVDALLLEATR